MITKHIETRNPTRHLVHPVQSGLPRPLHPQDLRKVVQEHHPGPVGHAVGAGPSGGRANILGR